MRFQKVTSQPLPFVLSHAESGIVMNGIGIATEIVTVNETGIGTGIEIGTETGKESESVRDGGIAGARNLGHDQGNQAPSVLCSVIHPHSTCVKEP